MNVTIAMLAKLTGRVAVLSAALMLAACNVATMAQYEPAPEATLKPRDKDLLSKAKYVNTPPRDAFRRAIVTYHRKELPGSIVVDSDNHYLYYVLPEGKAIRYGVTVGEDALSFSGIAKIGNLQEWPRWTPTADIHKRFEGLPKQVDGGVDNPLGARGIYLYANGRDTLYRIHGTNQPEYIGESISSGCIRMTNEDVIDLYSRVKLGSIVVVLDRKAGDSPQKPKEMLANANANSL